MHFNHHLLLHYYQLTDRMSLLLYISAYPSICLSVCPLVCPFHWHVLTLWYKEMSTAKQREAAMTDCSPLAFKCISNEDIHMLTYLCIGGSLCVHVNDLKFCLISRRRRIYLYNIFYQYYNELWSFFWQRPSTSASNRVRQIVYKAWSIIWLESTYLTIAFKPVSSSLLISYHQ